MRIRDGLEIDEDKLAEICRKYNITELALFGSVLRDDFTDESDIDVLYVGDLPKQPWFGEYFDLKEDLEALFGRTVDPVPKDRVHWYIREKVHREARQIYVAA